MNRFLPLLFLAFFYACTPLQMSVSNELRTADTYPVKGRQGLLIKQKLSFGEYATSTVKRSWTRGSSSRSGISAYSIDRQQWINLIGTEYIDKKQTFRFTMQDGARQSEVYAASRFEAEDLHIGNNENSIVNIALDLMGRGGASESLFYLQVFTDSADRPWQLLLDNDRAQAAPKKYKGVFAQSPAAYYTLLPVTRMEHGGKSGNILGGSIGYEIYNSKGTAVAAVSLVDNGTVYLGKTTGEERFLMANLCAALLLQQQIDE